MLFKPEMIEQIVAGNKTQTRRLRKAGETAWCGHLDLQYILTVVSGSAGRVKWQVGRDYAVQPGRGKPGALWRPETGDIFYPAAADDTVDGFVPLRIRITGIRKEDVRKISKADALAEGFKDILQEAEVNFWLAWCGFYDSNAGRVIAGRLVEGARYRLRQRPDERYQAWALEFEIARGGETSI